MRARGKTSGRWRGVARWSAIGSMVGAISLAGYALADRPASDLGAASCHILGEASSSESGFFSDIFKVYTPRRQCMYYEAPVIWLHFFSDLIIAVAYYSIPVGLVYFVSRRKDIAFHWIFLMFAGFILACGTTHVFGVIDLWYPVYKVDGIVRFLTAAISIVTAIALWPLIPKALALPSPAQLENQVQLRTAELGETNRSLMMEIRAREKAEEERAVLLRREREARAEAERANQMKDEFLATLSHELRTPLNAIMGWSHILRAQYSQDGALCEGLDVISRSTRTQVKLIEDLLDMSRIETGKINLDIQRVDFSDVVNATLQVIEPAAATKGIRLLKDIPPSAGKMVNGDSARLQQVIGNLLSNAVKFTPSDGTINVRLEYAGPEMRLTVADNGEGIRPEFLSHLFERFRQGDSSTTRRHGGLGIGLALVRKIVELHGGRVTAHSEGLGRGSQFVVTLPLRSASPGGEAFADAASSPNSELAETGQAQLSRVRILVVDDQKEARDMLKRFLEGAGATVSVASSAQEAIELVKREPPDLLLSDIGMPDEDGYSLIRRIRSLSIEEGGAVPAVAVTAMARGDDRDRAIAEGFQQHLAKPFELDVLLKIVVGLTIKS